MCVRFFGGYCGRYCYMLRIIALQLGNERHLYARCSLNGIAKRRDTESYMTCFALNEWDAKAAGGVDWRLVDVLSAVDVM